MRKTAPKNDLPHKGARHSDALGFLLRLTRGRDDVVQYQSPYGAVYLINHPDYVGRVLQDKNYVRGPLLKLALGEGLITSEGAYWRSQRRMAQPAFHQESIATFGTLMTDAIIAMLRRWKTVADTGRPVEVAGEMTQLTLRIIGKALFGVDLASEADALIEAMTVVVEDLGSLIRTVFDSPYQMSPSRNRRLERSLEAFDRIVYGIIKNRRQENDETRNLLALFLSGHDGTTGKILNDRQLRDEIVTMLVAGHETTANMLSWAWYLLSENPGVEQRLYEELAGVVGSRLPTLHDLRKLPYHRMVLQESLRLYPPVWFISRANLAEDKIGEYTIPRNSRIVLSPYAMHRHPAYWENAEQFDPERFTPERSEGRPHYAYFPFAGGHHLCLGNNLAMMEGQLVLAMVGQRYRLRLVPGHPVEADPLITLRHRHGLPMTLDSRSEIPFDS
jgi:cytochrome P450